MNSGRKAIVHSVPLRASLSLMEIELRTAVEFYEHTASNFQHKLRAIVRDFATLPRSEWERDLGGGMTMGELASDQRHELEALSEMNGYFGTLTAYSVFERCLFYMFRDAKRLKLITDKRYQKSYLTLDGYKEVFKIIGIDLDKSPFKWIEIRKLQLLRNAIAHHGGFVTPDYAPRVERYGYKVGETIVIDDDYFRSSVTLVRETYSAMVRQYDGILKAGPPATLVSEIRKKGRARPRE